MDLERRRVLGAAVYSLAALALPTDDWWAQMARTGRTRAAADGRRVGRADVDAVQDMVGLFSRVDQRRGGGHARTAVVQYLTSDVAQHLRGRFADEHLRRSMFTAAAELAYFPQLDVWSREWAERLGPQEGVTRDVSWAIFRSTGPKDDSAAGFFVHFRDEHD